RARLLLFPRSGYGICNSCSRGPAGFCLRKIEFLMASTRRRAVSPRPIANRHSGYEAENASSQNPFDHLPVHIRETEITAVVPIGKLRMIESEQRQDGG